MKKYNVFYSEESWCMINEENNNGEWVPASVAQALYDALVNLRRESKLIQFDVVDSGIDDAIYGADSALSLADGEELL